MGHEAPVLFLMILGSAFLGSWHCAGMCGPLVGALSAGQRIWLYHLGRGFSYTLAGALAGWVGQQGLKLPPLPLKIAAGVLILAALLFSFGVSSQGAWSRSWAQKSFRLMKWRKEWLFLTGFLSVFLPCGWLWSFLFAAAASGSAASGSLVLFALWLGSLPALALIGGYVRTALPAAPPKIRRWASLLVVAAGCYSLFSHFFLAS
ncbi:MAG: sulfite exporter TauE/SafE family protein [Bdellovibrionaceae bacterium]|nr:sulfite exporter TauE/SafE family protein [Pseudobdellovibrionaceae bacterium]